ncbi:MAG: EamA family transporter [Candidatus Eisenbacteria bacterium]
MSVWMRYAIAAALLYGLHQVFTKLAAQRIGEGVGGFVVEVAAALTVLVYLGYLKYSGSWPQSVSAPGIVYSVLTGICVGAGTVAFFLLFQKGGPLSAVPMILAAGAALMAVVGIAVFRESAHWTRLVGIGFAIAGMYLMQYAPAE